MRCGLNRLHAQSKAMLAAMLSAFGLVASAGAQGSQADAALVSRGAYLARAADCAPCHTGDASKPFAGGLALKTPFGTLFSVNITSDPETGIGKWTFDEFKNALHQGIRADGAYLYPGMPFDAFTKIEEDDLEALWAYVRRIPPVKAPNPQNQLSFPFDVRLGMLAWRELFFSPGYFKPAAGKSAEWNRGAYLVEALAHCSDCHSPRNIMGAIKGKALFTGTEVDGFYAPDIASGALAKTWTSLDFSNSISLWRRMKPATAVLRANSIASERCGLRFADCESGGVRLPAIRVLVGARRRSERRNGLVFARAAAQEELKARRRYR